MKILKLRLKNVTQILRGIGLYEFELDEDYNAKIATYYQII